MRRQWIGGPGIALAIAVFGMPAVAQQMPQQAAATTPVQVSPAVAGQTFFGYEHPMARMTVENGRLREHETEREEGNREARGARNT